jgi:hypothetical protein
MLQLQIIMVIKKNSKKILKLFKKILFSFLSDTSDIMEVAYSSPKQSSFKKYIPLKYSKSVANKAAKHSQNESIVLLSDDNDEAEKSSKKEKPINSKLFNNDRGIFLYRIKILYELIYYIKSYLCPKKKS